MRAIWPPARFGPARADRPPDSGPRVRAALRKYLSRRTVCRVQAVARRLRAEASVHDTSSSLSSSSRAYVQASCSDLLLSFLSFWLASGCDGLRPRVSRGKAEIPRDIRVDRIPPTVNASRAWRGVWNPVRIALPLAHLEPRHETQSGAPVGRGKPPSLSRSENPAKFNAPCGVAARSFKAHLRPGPDPHRRFSFPRRTRAPSPSALQSSSLGLGAQSFC